VRVKQTANQYEETNVEREVALRMADRSVDKARWGRMIELGVVRRIGRKWT